MSLEQRFALELCWPRIVFGAGALERLPDEVARLGGSRVLVVCTPGRGAEGARVRALLGDAHAATLAQARLHVPEPLVRTATAQAAGVGADLAVAVGGGSAIGLAKALSLRGGPPYIAIPTTYSGSEMTPIWGITEEARKTTGRDARVRARTVIYDPLLTLSLPAGVTGASGMNALAHCVEALYAPDANPVTTLLAAEGARALVHGLRGAVRAGRDEAARATTLYGACLAGSALAAVAMGLHHRICHALGGMLDLPHAETHAVVLPHVIHFNVPAAPHALRTVADVLGAADAAGAVFDLATELGCATSLRAFGAREADLAAVAAHVAGSPYPNPRPYTAADVQQILAAAWTGRRPAAPS